MARGRFGHGFSKEKTHEFLEWISHMTWTLKSDLCEVKMTERPSLMISRIRFHRKRRAWGSIPVVGSSWRDAWQPVSSRTKIFLSIIRQFFKSRCTCGFWDKSGPLYQMLVQYRSPPPASILSGFSNKMPAPIATHGQTHQQWNETPCSMTKHQANLQALTLNLGPSKKHNNC